MNFPASQKTSIENVDTHGTLWGGLFGSRVDVLLLGAGIFFILLNIVMFFGMDIRPSTWLFYLNMRHWGVSIHLSVALWTIALWLASESTDIVEDYIPTIRMITAICILLAIVFALQNSFSVPRSTPTEHSRWFSAFIVIVVGCAVRSLFLLYDYRYEGDESIDLEEAQWFWGLSGFLFAALIIIWVMCIVHVKTPTGTEVDDFKFESLYISCQNELNALIRHGGGSLAIRTLGFLIFTSSVAFFYVAGRWALIFLSRFRGE